MVILGSGKSSNYRDKQRLNRGGMMRENKNKLIALFGTGGVLVLCFILFLVIRHNESSKDEYGEIESEQTSMTTTEESDNSIESFSEDLSLGYTPEEAESQEEAFQSFYQSEKYFTAIYYNPETNSYDEVEMQVDNYDFTTMLSAYHDKVSHTKIAGYIYGNIGVIELNSADFMKFYQLNAEMEEAFPMVVDMGGPRLSEGATRALLMGYYQTAMANYSIKNVQFLSYGKPIDNSENGFLFDLENTTFDPVDEHVPPHINHWQPESE